MKRLVAFVAVLFTIYCCVYSHDGIFLKNSMKVYSNRIDKDNSKIYFSILSDYGDHSTFLSKSEIQKTDNNNQQPIASGSIVFTDGTSQKFKNLKFLGDSISLYRGSVKSTYSLTDVKTITKRTSQAGYGFLTGCLIAGFFYLDSELKDLDTYKAPIFPAGTYDKMRTDSRNRALALGGITIFVCTLVDALFLSKEKVIYSMPASLSLFPGVQINDNNINAGITLRIVFH